MFTPPPFAWVTKWTRSGDNLCTVNCTPTVRRRAILCEPCVLCVDATDFENSNLGKIYFRGSSFTRMLRYRTNCLV